MLDIKIIRKNPEKYEELLKRKVPSVSLNEILALDREVRGLKTLSESQIHEKKLLSKKLYSEQSNNEDRSLITSKINVLSKEVEETEEKLEEKNLLLKEQLSLLPNVPEENIPVSFDIKDNEIIKTFKTKSSFSFSPKNHLELNTLLQLFDFSVSGKISGSGWPMYRGDGALLEWALLSFMLEKQQQHGFEICFPPLMVKKEILYGSGQIPKFDGQYYEVSNGSNNLYLIPTAEVPLNGLHYDDILEEKILPIKYASYTPCFRKEAGAAGSQERGLIRLHQFNKVEMFAFTKPEQSLEMFDFMLSVAEDILQSLNLHYRLSLLATGDMSFTASKTVDVEVWLPGQDRYYEVSSISNCTDFQARRSKTRYRTSQGELHFVHTLNGSGLATPRLMVALLENNQNSDGSVEIPEVLQKYIKKSKLEPKK